ncbi:mucin-2 isoform X1 [Corythoichthys intestinalis]|uniref:mucin-2 isoform X1 n=1 Tax=Corythoichthys intestinalis TaxID=161448 RepID=UPI0025A4F269|nr:mucin-2 isoform X1 [Corythoichthys intestinalis]
MASQCKRQQCSIDRRGFRQELDSWRHKLIHCVGFESILEGLFGTELVEDLQLFKDLEPVAVSDWSFDENCLFCCFRRDKVKEHLISLSSEDSLQDPLKPLVVKDQTTISKLEKQAEEFLNAVLCNKDVPSFTDPHIPVVAREILQKMIRQFATEYTSKTSSPQDSGSAPKPSSDQSRQTPSVASEAQPGSPGPTVAGPAHSHNPVLSKLLMADQEAPLDLTIKKTPSEPSEQDGVLDLSIKKSRHSLPLPSPRLSPKVYTIKGECQDVRISKAKELQSTSTLEQFMTKLCRRHQRTIVDALVFLQTEVAASKTWRSRDSGIQGAKCSTPKSDKVTPVMSFLECPNNSTQKIEVLDMSCSIESNSIIESVPENVVPLTRSAAAYPVLDNSSGSENNRVLLPVDTENNSHGDHAPLKMKILKSSNVAAGKKLSCVLTTSLTSDSDLFEVKQSNARSLKRIETPSARLSSSLKRQHQLSPMHHPRQRGAAWQAKGVPTKDFSVPEGLTADSPQTARKTIRPSSNQHTKHAHYRTVDPDVGHCDIVYINKPITECFKDQTHLIPRRNARKSTRGHLYSDEIWELKTVRTLAGRATSPNQMPEVITLVTPKQILSKPVGVPPVDMPFAGACIETISEGTPLQQADVEILSRTGDMVEMAASEAETFAVVETSQTDQAQSKLEDPLPFMNSEIETSVNEHRTNTNANDQLTHSEPEELPVTKLSISEERVANASFDAVKENEPETKNSSDEVMSETAEPDTSENISTATVESQLLDNKIQSSEVLPLHTSKPSPTNHIAIETKIDDETPSELQQEMLPENTEETGVSKESGLAEEPIMTELTNPTAVVESVPTLTVKEPDDISSKTLDSLLKELPPWRRKKGSVIQLPTRLQQAETVIVGYVNGKPVSASDRSLRHRPNSSSTSPMKSPIKQTRKELKPAFVESTETNNLVRNTTESEIPTESIVKTPDNLLSSSNLPENTITEASPSNLPEKPITEVSSKSKHFKKPKQIKPTGTKRQLRSAFQKTDETLGLAPSSNVSSSIAPPKSSATPPPPPLSPSSFAPIAESPPPVTPEKSPVSTVQKTTVELNIEKTQSMEENPTVPDGQIVRSSKVGEQDNINENQQFTVELNSPVQNNASKTEIQTNETRGTCALRMEPERAIVSSSDDASGRSHGACGLELPKRMPLRSERSKTEQSSQPTPQSPPDNKKLSLRSQRFTSTTTDVLSASKKNTEVTSLPGAAGKKITRNQLKGSSVSTASASPVMGHRHHPRKQAKTFLETLTREENQQLLTNLNLKYDKMQKGWLQIDKDGQTTAKHKNKADRQAAIWKSKRRARKPKSIEHQKFSPVQMLFMKDFSISHICSWFLESTETKSLIIVKKVNTRLPSETQLCFHSSSSGSCASQGVFPSLQAERLKKHLKKFAVTSPVKSNPKSQKLIAKALEQETASVKGKDRREPPSATQTSNQSDIHVDAPGHGASQKATGKPKNPASARILRKYTNIREKLQVQQTNVNLKGISKSLKDNSLKRISAESASELAANPPAKATKMTVIAAKPMKAQKMLNRKKIPQKRVMRHRAAKAQHVSQVRCSRRLSTVFALSKKKVGKKASEVAESKANAEKHQINDSQEKGENKDVTEADLKSADAKPSNVLDQVLTRSQRKMEAESKKPKIAKELADHKAARKVEDMGRKGVMKRNRSAIVSRTRSQELMATPAKRSRVSR